MGFVIVGWVGSLTYPVTSTIHALHSSETVSRTSETVLNASTNILQKPHMASMHGARLGCAAGFGGWGGWAY